MMLLGVAETEPAGPSKFAHAIPVDINMERDGEWDSYKDGASRVWRMMISSPGATSIGLYFKDFYLPAGAELYVIGSKLTLGAFTAEKNNKPWRQFSTSPLGGEAVVLEYIEPLGLKEKPALVIGSVAHGFARSPLNFRESASCNVDIACAEGTNWRDQINSVVLFITDQGQRHCTGAMINNVNDDGAQYMLTANHCILADVSNYIGAFNYQCKSCGCYGEDPIVQTVQGFKLMANWAPSDFALLQIVEAIPDGYNVFMAGWDTSMQAPTNVIGIHHPNGDVKKISVRHGKTLRASWDEAPRQFHFQIPFWTKGVTERGSSGSPLFNAHGLVVGHLHGGQASCVFREGYDIYGAVGADYNASLNERERAIVFLNPQRLPITSFRGIYLTMAREKNKEKEMDTNATVVINRMLTRELIWKIITGPITMLLK